MVAEEGTVGGLQIPVAAGNLKERIADPTVDALLDFTAFYIKDALDAKLTKLLGTSSDAVPAANRFPFDPMEARGHAKKLPHPSLFCWWEGQSTREEQTVMYVIRKRVIQMMYVFDDLPHFEEMERRAGLMSAVDGAMHQMSTWQVRSDFGHGTDPVGSWISTTVADIQHLEWEWNGGMPGRFGIDEGPRAERRFAKRSGRDWPALKGSWNISERISGRTLQDPQDLLTDTPMTINASDGESTDTTELFTWILPAPDGSEKL